MAVTFQFPEGVEKRLRQDHPNFDAEAREASALELFRRGKLTHFELSQVLDLDRHATDAYLKSHHVYQGSLTGDDLAADAETLQRVLGPVPH